MSNLAAALLDALDEDALDRLARALAPRLQRLTTSATAQDGWMDSPAAAAYLGLSTHALHRLTATRRIPCSQDRPGGRCYFKRSDLDEWRAQGRR